MTKSCLCVPTTDIIEIIGPDDDDEDSRPPPPHHVRRLEETLLDEDFTILKRFKSEIDEISAEGLRDIDDTNGQDDSKQTDWHTSIEWTKILSSPRISEQERIDVMQTYEWAEDTQTKVRRYMSFRNRRKERFWDDFYHNQFFAPLQQDNVPKNLHTSREARSRFYYDAFHLERDVKWTTFHSSCCKAEKAPKPDLVAHFQVHDEDEVSFAPARDRWHHDTKPGHSIAGNFSKTTLTHLGSKGLISSCFNATAATKSTKPSSDARACLGYPWLVVEYKLAGESIGRNCWHQAANAARCILRMYNNLASEGWVEETEIPTAGLPLPPVVTVTGLENKIQVWIVWSKQLPHDDQKSHEKGYMKCIWHGNMESFNDILKFRAILENAHTWAMRELKGRLSVYLDQWLNTHPIVEIQTPTRPSTTGRAATEPIKMSTKYWKVGGPGTPVTPKDIEKMTEKQVFDQLSQMTEQLKLNATEPKRKTVKGMFSEQRQPYNPRSGVPWDIGDGGTDGDVLSPTARTKRGRRTSKQNSVNTLNSEIVSLNEESNSCSEHEYYDTVNEVVCHDVDYDERKMLLLRDQLGTSPTRSRPKKAQKALSTSYLSPRSGQSAIKEPRRSPRLRGKTPEHEEDISTLDLQ